MQELKQVKDKQQFYAFFVRDGGFWFLDCSSWDKIEILACFYCDKTPLSRKRLVKLPDDSEGTIKKARRYLNNRNTKSFVDLSKGELD